MPEATLVGTSDPLQVHFDVALVDLDGVAYKGPDAIPSAPPALAAARGAGMQLVFVTNNASREPEEVSGHLTSLGIPTRVDEVITAAQAGALMLTEHVATGARVLVIGGNGLRTAVSAAGYVVVDSAEDAPVAVIQGYSPEIGWKEFAEATYAVQAGARFFATNLDMTLPTNRGMAPGNGTLVGVVTAATGVTPLAAGKPEPAMFLMAAQRTNARFPLAIGDRLDTDLKGARAAGIPGLLVLTGVNDARDALLAPADQRPSFIGTDLSSLADAHSAPTMSGGWWYVGDARARVTERNLFVEQGTDINRVRAACVAAWAAADAGETVVVETLPHLGVAF